MMSADDDAFDATLDKLVRALDALAERDPDALDYALTQGRPAGSGG